MGAMQAGTASAVRPATGGADADAAAWQAAAGPVPVGLARTDRHGRCTQVNRRWCELTAVPAGDAVGARWLSAVHPDDARRAAQAWDRLRTGTSELEIDCRLGPAAGNERWVRAGAAPARADDTAAGYLVTLTDITDRRRAESRQREQLAAERRDREHAEQAQLRLAADNARLQAAAEFKTQFLATVSHELRTPLTSIVAFAELIKGEQDQLTSETEAFLDIIQRNAARLTRLVGDLLLLSRLETGAIPLQCGPVDVAQLVREAALAAAARSAERDVRVEVDAQDGPALTADRHWLAQLVDNLVSNAVKFSPGGGRVQARACCDGERWLIEVADSGIGVPPAELDRLFDRFFRASNAQAAVPGTGLGLSVVKTVAELHHGAVTVDSTPGAGTTFGVSLPLRP